MARKIAYRKKRQNRTGMLLVTMVVLMRLVVVTVKSEEIAEYGKYTQTKKYVEELAKDKLGLVYEGEIIFKDEK